VETPRTDAAERRPRKLTRPEGSLETLGTYGGEMIRLVHGTAHHPHVFPFSPCTSAGLQPLQHRVALFNGHIRTAMCVGATP
jgi:hypothetical protein